MARSGVLGGRGEVKFLPGSQRQKLPKLAVLFMSNNMATRQDPGQENNLYVCCPACDPIGFTQSIAYSRVFPKKKSLCVLGIGLKNLNRVFIATCSLSSNTSCKCVTDRNSGNQELIIRRHPTWTNSMHVLMWLCSWNYSNNYIPRNEWYFAFSTLSRVPFICDSSTCIVIEQ